jgi:hypothetical protein
VVDKLQPAVYIDFEPTPENHMSRKSYALTEDNERNLRASAKAAGVTISALLNRCVAESLARGITIRIDGAARSAPQAPPVAPAEDPDWLTDPVVVPHKW